MLNDDVERFCLLGEDEKSYDTAWPNHINAATCADNISCDRNELYLGKSDAYPKNRDLVPANIFFANFFFVVSQPYLTALNIWTKVVRDGGKQADKALNPFLATGMPVDWRLVRWRHVFT